MERGRRKTLVGIVVSNKMDKTAVVAVERRVRHPLYKKIVRRTKRYKAHDAANSSSLGDVVRITETRPLSKEKRWRIAQVLVKGNVAEVAPREIGAPKEALAVPPPPPAPAVPREIGVPEEALAVAPPAPAAPALAEQAVEAPTASEQPVEEPPGDEPQAEEQPAG